MSLKGPFRFRFLWVVLSIVLLLTGLESLLHLATTSWWFESIGFSEVFQTRLRWQGAIATLSFTLWWGLLFANYRFAQWQTRHRHLAIVENRAWDPYIPRFLQVTSLILITLLAFSAAGRGAQSWEIGVKYLNQVSFGQLDPIYQRDLGFYIFQLPLYEILHRTCLELLVWSILIPLAIYGIKGEIRPERGWKYFLTGAAKAHLCILLATLAVVIAVGFWLARYQLLYSISGPIFGAGYTDIHARLPAYVVMGCITLVVAALFILSLWRSGFLLPLTALGLYGGVFLVATLIYPVLQQKFVVEPNELAKESPYIRHNIEYTRKAYALDAIAPSRFDLDNQLNTSVLSQNASILDNIRLWDYRPLQETYSSLQTLRPYYRFQDVDIDRYSLNNDYRQVMLSARELLQDALPEPARTWVNQRLVYTHGYGLVMSPVNEVTPDGLPVFFIQDLPPQSQVDITIEQPRIYYGETTYPYILTGTSQQEFDYPLGDSNANFLYDGQGGVTLDTWQRRWAYAYEMGSVQLLLSNYLTPNSRIHYHRPVVDRITQIAPFLSLDSDPYLVTLDGRLQWVVDAYTTSDHYPYSQPLARSDGRNAITSDLGIQAIADSGSNYIRDAVKVTVDAYDGTVQFYIVDQTDPILAVYQRIFPTLFRPLRAAPPGLREHFRYPYNLFKIQAQLYRAYHMQQPDVFYNREDLWDFPTQVGQSAEADEIMEPYYVTMRLPSSPTEEFLLSLPFTPAGKNNMVSWMVARCDGDYYGQRLSYEFSRQALIYGPRQIDTRIDQNPEISQQLTLWNQEGSEVFRGDLLVIPIERSLLYVEPIYLQATGQNGAIPELRRVIVAYTDTIVMSNTLETALTQIFGTAEGQTERLPSATSPTSPTRPPAAPTGSDTVTPNPINPATIKAIEAALAAYEQGQAALQKGDWEAYGEAQSRLERLLKELAAEPSDAAPNTTPAQP